MSHAKAWCVEGRTQQVPTIRGIVGTCTIASDSKRKHTSAYVQEAGKGYGVNDSTREMDVEGLQQRPNRAPYCVGK